MFSPSIKCLQSTQNPETFQEIQHNINILKRDQDMNNLIKIYKIINSKHQPLNLKMQTSRKYKLHQVQKKRVA